MQICKKLDITINTKKLTVSKLSKTFIFLKKRIRLSDTGKIIIRIGRHAVTRARRRLKKLIVKALDKKEKFTFVDFYQSKGWKVGNNSMKDWKASVRTWERRRTTEKPQNKFINHSQRQYDPLELEKALNRGGNA